MKNKRETPTIHTLHILHIELIQKITNKLVPCDAGRLAQVSKLTLFNTKHNLTKNKAQYFSTLVAQGKQEAAMAAAMETVKTPLTVSVQDLLLTPAPFTDYSGRVFNCTAYEYAYWAKDTHMCRMLEQQMDKDTKAVMLKHCEAIENNGLTYHQNGTECCTRHFDFTPLKQALQNYIDGWVNRRNYHIGTWAAMKALWMRVGMAQRDIPVHVLNEYCRKDRSFDPLPTFCEDKLPRELTLGGSSAALFSSGISAFLEFGVDLALIRGREDCGFTKCGTMGDAPVRIDLAAMERLDKVRTSDLTQSLENLKSVEPELDNSNVLLYRQIK